MTDTFQECSGRDGCTGEKWTQDYWITENENCNKGMKMYLWHKSAMCSSGKWSFKWSTDGLHSRTEIMVICSIFCLLREVFAIL